MSTQLPRGSAGILIGMLVLHLGPCIGSLFIYCCGLGMTTLSIWILAKHLDKP